MKIFTLFGGCTQDQQNQSCRKEVEFPGGNCWGTYANGSTTKNGTIRSGKATTGDKGYYFWDANQHYVQTPMENTFIEAIG